MANEKELGELRELRGKVKEKWADVTDDDFEKAEGKVEQLAGIIQTKYGEAKDKVRAELDKLRDSI